MNYEEFGKVSAEFLNGCASSCADYMWNEVELVYMNSEITKRELAFAYWKATGYYESLAKSVKELIESKAEAERHLKLQESEDVVYEWSEKIFESAHHVIFYRKKIKERLEEWDKKNGGVK